VIGEVPTGVIVALLGLLNVGPGTRQELTGRASVDALAKMQVTQARVVRDGEVRLIAATDVVRCEVVRVVWSFPSSRPR
jgi:Ca2+-transporting ATPase